MAAAQQGFCLCSQGNSSAGVGADPNWTPLLTTVPEPDYPSGHGTLSGVAEAMLRKYAGHRFDHLAIVAASASLPLPPIAVNAACIHP